MCLLHKEEEHIRESLIRSKYSTWAPNRLITKNNHKFHNIKAHTCSTDSNTSTNNINNNHNNINIVVTYTKGLSINFKNICGKVEIQVHFKRGNTLRSLLVAPEDKDNITQNVE